MDTRCANRKFLRWRKLLRNQFLVNANDYQLLERTRIVAVQLTVNIERVVMTSSWVLGVLGHVRVIRRPVRGHPSV